MKEKLLALLKTKFVGVREATLERLAAKKAETVTEESQLQTIVDGMTFDYIIDSESDFKGTQISKMAAVAEYEKRFGLKDGKPIEEPSKKKDHKPDPKAGDDPRDAQINELKESLNKLTELVTGVVTGQQKTSKQSQVAELLKKSKISENYQKKWLNRIDVDSETPFEDQIKELESEFLDIGQQHIAGTITGKEFIAPGKGEISPVSPEVQDLIAEKFPKAAEGK